MKPDHPEQRIAELARGTENPPEAPRLAFAGRFKFINAGPATTLRRYLKEQEK